MYINTLSVAYDSVRCTECLLILVNAPQHIIAMVHARSADRAAFGH